MHTGTPEVDAPHAWIAVSRLSFPKRMMGLEHAEGSTRYAHALEEGIEVYGPYLHIFARLLALHAVSSYGSASDPLPRGSCRAGRAYDSRGCGIRSCFKRQAGQQQGMHSEPTSSSASIHVACTYADSPLVACCRPTALLATVLAADQASAGTRYGVVGSLDDGDGPPRLPPPMSGVIGESD